MPRLLTPALLALALAACASEEKEYVVPGDVLPVAPEWTAPPDWKELTPAAFETMVEAELPEDVATPFSRETRRNLAWALSLENQTSVRAAVLCGRSRYAGSAFVLLERLEKRRLSSERNGDAGDVVAAAAIARFPDPTRYSERMLRLAVGPRPHPDLEVRVECACTALAAGRDEVLPFLLSVIRIGTWAGQEDARDFAVSDTTAWARGRAAQALSVRAGVPITYRTDAPIPDREREAQKLQELLAEVIQALPPPPSADDEEG